MDEATALSARGDYAGSRALWEQVVSEAERNSDRSPHPVTARLDMATVLLESASRTVPRRAQRGPARPRRAWTCFSHAERKRVEGGGIGGLGREDRQEHSPALQLTTSSRASATTILDDSREDEVRAEGLANGWDARGVRRNESAGCSGHRGRGARLSRQCVVLPGSRHRLVVEAAQRRVVAPRAYHSVGAHQRISTRTGSHRRYPGRDRPDGEHGSNASSRAPSVKAGVAPMPNISSDPLDDSDLLRPYHLGLELRSLLKHASSSDPGLRNERDLRARHFL